MQETTHLVERANTERSHHKVIIIILLGLLTFLYISGTATALDKVIANSGDWRDVYSSMLYASLSGIQPGMFLISANDGTVILYTIPKSINGTLIVSSRIQPYIVNYKATMDSQGYTNVEELVTSDANLDLARRIVNEQGIKNFIILDDGYGYNALSVAAYAVLEKYYVLFANDRNIGTIDSFLSGVKPNKVIIFGQVVESVKTRLAKYSPETINTGDRFDNNIEMVKLYQNITHAKQVLMSNGQFIEASLMSGQDPVLYIGKDTVPQQIIDYIKTSEFQVAILIGNELINSATTIRRQIGISVFVKFAQGARNPQGAISSVEDLDKFPMPSYTLNLEIYSILYNSATKALWVTYHNKATVGTYLKGTITLLSDGQNAAVVGDNDPVFIDRNQYKTLIYDLSSATITSSNLTAKIYTLFGEGTKSLENILQGTMDVQTVQILDNSLINITDVSYDKGKGRFLVTIKNIGSVDTYVSVEMLNVYVNGEYNTVSSSDVTLLNPGKSKVIPIDIVLSDSDIQNNPIVKVQAYYGERQNSLIKTIYGEYAFKLVKFDIVYYVLIVLIVILALLILFGRKKCPNCGANNSRIRKLCKKCNHPLYGKHHKMHIEEPK